MQSSLFAKDWAELWACFSQSTTVWVWGELTSGGKEVYYSTRLEYINSSYSVCIHLPYMCDSFVSYITISQHAHIPAPPQQAATAKCCSHDEASVYDDKCMTHRGCKTCTYFKYTRYAIFLLYLSCQKMILMQNLSCLLYISNCFHHWFEEMQLLSFRHTLLIIIDPWLGFILVSNHKKKTEIEISFQLHEELSLYFFFLKACSCWVTSPVHTLFSHSLSNMQEEEYDI